MLLKGYFLDIVTYGKVIGGGLPRYALNVELTFLTWGVTPFAKDMPNFLEEVQVKSSPISFLLLSVAFHYRQ